MRGAAKVNSDHRNSETEQGRGCWHTIIIALMLLLAGGGSVSAWMVERTILIPYKSHIYPNTYVLGENLGGFTVEEATRHMEEVFATHSTGDLILTDGDQVWRVPWSEAGMHLDINATARQAFAADRDKGWRTLLSMWLGKKRDVAPVFTIDAEATRRALERIAPELYKAPVDATLCLDGEQVITTSSQPGQALAIDATAEKIVNTVTHLGPDYPFAPTYRPVAASILDVSATKKIAEDMLSREIHLVAQGEHEGEIFRWEWKLKRDTIASWLQAEKTAEGFAIRCDESAIQATVAGLAAEPEADDWGFPTEAVVKEVIETFHGGGGEVAVEVSPPPRIYIVQAGDHMTTIASKFGMPPGLIAEVNPGIDLNQLQVGQELIIPPQDVLTPHETVPGKRIAISIAGQRLRVYENGQLLHDWACSTGKRESPTYKGQFQVVSKEEMAYASQWDLQMPHFIGVYRAGGDTYNGIHALPILSNGQRLWEGHLGSRASFGCIILGIEEAETLFNWAELGVPVTIE